VNKKPGGEQEPTSPSDVPTSLLSFVDRCVSLGMESVEDVADVVQDPTLARSLNRAANHRPLVGEPESVDSIVAEMRSIATKASE
jgi:hypothetical protein